MENQEKYLKESSRGRKKLPTSRGLAVAKTTVLVVVDGNTEKEYFEKLNELMLFQNLKFKPVKGNDISYYNTFKENYDLTHKYLILDIDCSNNNNQKRAERIRTILQSKDMKDLVYFNNYSFETFLLCHMTSFTTPIVKKEEYDPFMEKHFKVVSWGNNKDKRNIGIVVKEITEETFEKMILNVKKIYEKDCFKTPNSNMHKFFEKIKKIK